MRERAVRTSINEFSKWYEIWRSSPTVSNASEALLSATVNGVVHQAFGPAEFILHNAAHASAEVVEIANLIRHGRKPTIGALPAQTTTTANPTDSRGKNIHSLRARIRYDNRDVLAWLDLSLEYAALGLREKSIRSMISAIGLAPENRTVIRSAARMFVHFGDNDSAITLVRRAQYAKSDPWLLSAEVSISDISNKTPRFIKEAEHRATELVSLPAFSSELASSVGTWHLIHGNKRKAKQFLNLSLRVPNDNSLAQGNWVSEIYPKLIQLDQRAIRNSTVWEARAISSYFRGNWSEAIRETMKWQKEEPFASRPSLLGSFVAASIACDIPSALKISQLGYQANPDHIVVLNNYVYSLILSGEMDEASKLIHKFNFSDETSIDNCTLLATKGLFLFRSGNAPEGRKEFDRAIEAAKNSSRFSLDHSLEALVLLHLIRAELGASDSDEDHISPILGKVPLSTRAIPTNRLAVSGVASAVASEVQNSRFIKNPVVASALDGFNSQLSKLEKSLAVDMKRSDLIDSPLN